MGSLSGSRPYVRFAAISVLVVVLVAVAGGLAGIKLVGDRERTGAIREIRSLVVAPLHSSLDTALADDALSEEERFVLDAAVQPLLDGDVRAVSVWSLDGAIIYRAGPAITAPADAPNEGASRTFSQDLGGDGTYVTRTGGDGYVTDVAQRSAPITDAARQAQASLIVAVVILAALMMALLQGAFWFGIRSLAHQHGRLAYLYDTGQQLRASLDVEDVMTRLAGDAAQLAHARYGFVALYDAETSDLVLKTAYDAATGDVQMHHKPLDEWFARRAIATNMTVFNANGGNSYKAFFGADAELDAKSPLLCAPLSMRDRVVGVVGVLGLATGREGTYNPEQVRLVQELALQAVTAVEQAQLFARVRADATEIEASYDSTLKALMAALDAKDEVTEGHCERVAKLTIQLAREMDVPPSMLVHIERGALLHDVGKIGVPDAILKKPNSLNDTEWEAMRKHPLLAGLMVSKVGFLEPALPILLYHHERYDGGGYPFGLSGDNIPIEARIFMVIDAYDAMTSDRPYRPAMRHVDAMREIRAHNGTQFDPDVVQAFEALMASRPDLREQAGTRVISSQDHDDGTVHAA